MRIQPELSEISIVLVGSLNPRIFTPDWFARNGLLTGREADEADLDVVHAQLVLLRFSGELFAHSRPAISNWTGLWYPSVECRRIGL